MERGLEPGTISGQIDVHNVVKYLWPLGIQTMTNPTRWKIFEFIVAHEKEMVSFTQMKRAFPKIKNATLVFHLQKLQEAHLIARKVKYEEKANTLEHHYCYYLPTSWGKVFLDIMVSAEQEALERYADELGVERETDNFSDVASSPIIVVFRGETDPTVRLESIAPRDIDLHEHLARTGTDQRENKAIKTRRMEA
jgi:DNA-binding HxlR family transcriptional regulator